MPDLASGLIYYLVFLFSTTLHEAAHAWAAKRGGDLTAYLGGQVSLDPRPHIKREPFGMVILPLLSVAVSGWPFGFASAPYDPNWALRHPRRAAWMALAGPGANLLLVLLAVLLIRIGMLAGVFYPPESLSFGHVTGTNGGGIWSAVAMLVSVFFSLNLVLLILNLIPVPPLDGSAAIPLLLSDRASARYQRFIWGQPALTWIGLLVAWRLFDSIFQPLFWMAVRLVYPEVSYG
ncbi:MAG: site-2 protease family protein [Gemmatimonadales bacterium]